jgi:hypothetical protein
MRDVQEGDVPVRELRQGYAVGQTANSFLRILSFLSQRNYHWDLIFILAFAYAVLVGPVNLRAGMKLSDYRLRIALLLATIAGFAWLFNVVGRRGQGEASVIHSLSYARAIDGDTYDVLQWINVFATRGAQYKITHAAPHNLYATGQDYEPVKGVIENGKNGRFVVDIPMFSRRAFLHEAEMHGDHIPVKIVNWDGAGALKRLALTVRPDFTKQILEGWAVQGDQVYAMKQTTDGLEFSESNKQPLVTFVSESDAQQFQVAYLAPHGIEVTNVESQFRKCVKPLIAWSLSAVDYSLPSASFPAVNARVQLFLFARSPQSFSVAAGSGLGKETGYVLYEFELFKPETTEGP